MQMLYLFGAIKLRICLFVLLMLCDSVVASEIIERHVTVLNNKRLDVTPRDVITRSSAIHCEATCRHTSWCVAANLLPDGRTCQLLSEEVSADDESLQSADGWTYLREYSANCF